MGKSLLNRYRIDRTAISVVKLDDPQNDWEYWQSRPPEERLQALELIRQINFGVASTTGRVQRVLTVSQFKPR